MQGYWSGNSYQIGEDAHLVYPPASIWDETGLSFNQLQHLASLNDSGQTFEQIAEAIDQMQPQT